jgi:hypothetical protein
MQICANSSPAVNSWPEDFDEPFSHGAPYLTIPRQEWLIIKLEAPDRAEGAGVGYIGLRIGKAGTKSVFRWRKR